MSLFRRRKAVEPAPQPAVPDAELDEEAAVQPAGQAATGGRAGGPLDENEVDDDVQRVDLGALRVPARPGMELRLELEDATQRVVAVVVALSGSTMQLQAFAAPRTEGVWNEIRTELAAEVERQGGSAEEASGSYGPELLARLPVREPDGATSHRPARFVGVDGPRWFLRAVFSGPAAAGGPAAAELEQLLRQTVVVRGSEAMAPRDLLPLKLPAPQPGHLAGEGGNGREQDGGAARPAPGGSG